MDDLQIKSLISSAISDAEKYDENELSEDRVRALEYYRGEMRDTPSQANRSKTISSDVADTVNWILPGLMRVFASSSALGTFEPVNENDRDFADQASQYINHKFWKEWNGYRVLWDAFHDALLLKNGIIKHWWDDSEVFETSVHTGLTEMELTDLVSDDEVEVLTSDDKTEVVDTPEGMQKEVTLYDVKIKRTRKKGRLRMEVIQPENFLIDSNSDCIDEEYTSFCAHKDDVTRSDLVKMGFDKDKVYSLPTHGDDSQEDDARDDYSREDKDDANKANEIIELYECYLNIDVDDDGVAERIRACMAGSGENGVLLKWDVWDDDLPFTDLVTMRIPHRFDGRSIADETMDIQQIKTVLVRQAIDNTYAHNNPQREAEKGSVLNPEQLTNPKFGGTIWKKLGSAPIISQVIAYTADKSFAALDYFDNVIEKRTGVSRSTMALDPDALQNQTATAVQAGKDSSYSKIELMARNLGEMGLKRLFRMLLRLVVKHQDRADIIRLNDEFVPMDPKHWNASMDVSIDVGLGTGSRDRDMSMLESVLQKQVMLIDRLAQSGFMPQALQLLPKLRNTLVRQAEAAGIRNAEDYYPEVSDEEIQKMMQQAGQPKQDPKIAMEAQKHQQDMQMKQAEMQANATLEQKKLEAEIMLKREQMAAEMELKRTQMLAEIELKRESAMFEAQSNINMQDIRLGGELG